MIISFLWIFLNVSADSLNLILLLSISAKLSQLYLYHDYRILTPVYAEISYCPTVCLSNDNVRNSSWKSIVPTDCRAWTHRLWPIWNGPLPARPKTWSVHMCTYRLPDCAAKQRWNVTRTIPFGMNSWCSPKCFHRYANELRWVYDVPATPKSKAPHTEDRNISRFNCAMPIRLNRPLSERTTLIWSKYRMMAKKDFCQRSDRRLYICMGRPETTVYWISIQHWIRDLVRALVTGPGFW